MRRLACPLAHADVTNDPNLALRVVLELRVCATPMTRSLLGVIAALGRRVRAQVAEEPLIAAYDATDRAVAAAAALRLLNSRGVVELVDTSDAVWALAGKSLSTAPVE
jgi:hypothetical protein